MFGQLTPQTKAGAERPNASLNDATSTPQVPRPSTEQKTTYRLFPVIKDLVPSGIPVDSGATSSPLNQVSMTNNPCTPSHQQPNPSYRPRKESMSSSVRSRKDSFTSFCGARRIQMRILSGGSTNTSGSKSTASTSTPRTSATSPPQQSRWSDETITSPLAATTPGPRTSFGSLLGRDSAQYPACFFEDDDDEEVPLRRKFGWKRFVSSIQEQQAKRESLGGRRSFSQRLSYMLLCGVCCGRSQ